MPDLSRIKQEAQRRLEQAKDAAGDLLDQAKETAGDLHERATGVAGDLRERASDATDQLREKAVELGGRAVDQALVVRDRAVKLGGELLVQAADTASDYLESRADSMREEARGQLQDVPEHLRQAKAHLQAHAIHEGASRLLGQDPHPNSVVVRDQGIEHAGQAVVKGLGGAAKLQVADGLDALAQRIRPTETIEPGQPALPPATTPDGEPE